jgi:hypothetical protein
VCLGHPVELVETKKSYKGKHRDRKILLVSISSIAIPADEVSSEKNFFILIAVLSGELIWVNLLSKSLPSQEGIPLLTILFTYGNSCKIFI